MLTSIKNCLNPCFNGISVELHSTCIATHSPACLNPCCNGIDLKLKFCRYGLGKFICLNPCFNGISDTFLYRLRISCTDGLHEIF